MEPKSIFWKVFDAYLNTKPEMVTHSSPWLFDFDLNVSVQNYESGNLFDLNTIPSEEEEEQSVNNSYEVIIPFSSGDIIC